MRLLHLHTALSSILLAGCAASTEPPACPGDTIVLNGAEEWYVARPEPVENILGPLRHTDR